MAAILGSASFLTLPLTAHADGTFGVPPPGTVSPRLDADDNEVAQPPKIIPPPAVAAPVAAAPVILPPQPAPVAISAPTPATPPAAILSSQSPVVLPPPSDTAASVASAATPEIELVAPTPPSDPSPTMPPKTELAVTPSPSSADTATDIAAATTLSPPITTIIPAPTPATDLTPLSVSPADHDIANNPAPAARYAEVKGLRQDLKSIPLIKGFDKKNAPLDLTSDSLEHDENAQTITAIGHVELIQAGQILHADKVIYHLDTDTAYAKGNVVITQPNGDVNFADEVQFDNRFGSGFVKGLQSYLTSGGRFIAHDGTREGSVTTMNKASYTPCECDEGRKGAPAWQIKGNPMIYHQDQNSIVAKDATFDVYGVPILWTPYISFPDGQVKQESGFLTPSFGYRSNLGAIMTSEYYWGLSPSQDAQLGSMVTTDKAPVLVGGYRQRFDQGTLKISGSATYSDYERLASDDVTTIDVGDRARGHLFADGLWDINDEWRAGADLRLTSDDAYLREYDFSHSDVLENQVYVERFSDRDYTSAKIMAFQDIRIGADRTAQPDALPEIDVNMVGDPNAMFGGRWNLDLSMLGLTRNGTDQPVDRFVAQAGWQRRYITDFGLVNTFNADVRGDAYYVDDHDPTAVMPGTKAVGVASRFFPDFQAMSSYPLAKSLQTMQIMVAPIAAITVSPTTDVNSSKIPNEDSQDVELSAQNLFDVDRFPGLDRIEDGSRATYGVRTGLYGYNGSSGDVFVGQSTNFSNQANLFPQGSGLSTQTSDLVGQITAMYNRRFGASYAFELNNATFAPEQHELSAFADWNNFRLNSRYVYDKALEGTDLDNNRAQLENNVSYDITHEWRVRVGAINDFGQDSGLRRATAGIDYFGCCISFSVTAERNLTSDATGDSGTSVTFRVGLKGLGGFQTPELVDKQTDGLWR